MNYRLVVRPLAEADLQHAFDWYDDQRAGLGAEFLAVVDGVLDYILANPLKYQAIQDEVRRALTPRFPFGVFFVVWGDVVSVLAVSHQAQDPQVWQDRAMAEDDDA